MDFYAFFILFLTFINQKYKSSPKNASQKLIKVKIKQRSIGLLCGYAKEGKMAQIGLLNEQMQKKNKRKENNKTKQKS